MEKLVVSTFVERVIATSTYQDYSPGDMVAIIRNGLLDTVLKSLHQALEHLCKSKKEFISIENRRLPSIECLENGKIRLALSYDVLIKE
jgi:hypothetical protein